MPEFDCPNPVPVTVKMSAGALDIVAEQRDTASVTVSPWDGSDASRDAAEQTIVEMRGRRLIVDTNDGGPRWLLRRSRVRVDIRIPLDCPLEVKIASADARCAGRYGDTNLSTASGDVAIEHVSGDASITSASGHVLVDRVDGGARVHGASGDITVTQAGAEITGGSASGDVTVEDAAGPVKLNTASGDLRIGRAHQGDVRLTSASGSVAVGVAAGTGVWLEVTTVSGRTRNGLDMAVTPPAGGQAQLRLAIRTVSGNVDIRRVALAPAA